MKAKSRVQTFPRELTLPREERRPQARKLRAEQAMRSERDTIAHSGTARNAAVEAERRREGGAGTIGRRLARAERNHDQAFA